MKEKWWLARFGDHERTASRMISSTLTIFTVIHSQPTKGNIVTQYRIHLSHTKMIYYGVVISLLALSANAFTMTPIRSLARASSTLSMSTTVAPSTQVLATAARDARGLAIDSISAVRHTLTSSSHFIINIIILYSSLIVSLRTHGSPARLC